MPGVMNGDLQFLQDGYVLCSCEGTAEEVIMGILLENKCLVFEKDDLLNEEVTRIRTASAIQTKFLNREFERQVYILRILDSKREQFNLGKLYKKRFPVYEIYTRPEIEMLMIWAEDKYHAFRNSGKKPSDYLQSLYPHQRIKSQEFIKRYFSSPDRLLQSICLYHHDHGHQSEYGLYHLLKNEYQR